MKVTPIKEFNDYKRTFGNIKIKDWEHGFFSRAAHKNVKYSRPLNTEMADYVIGYSTDVIYFIKEYLNSDIYTVNYKLRNADIFGFGSDMKIKEGIKDHKSLIRVIDIRPLDEREVFVYASQQQKKLLLLASQAGDKTL